MAKQRRKQVDFILLGALSILLLFGLIMLTSASSPVGLERFGDRFFFIKRQLLYGVLPGLVAFFILIRIPVKWYREYVWTIYALTIGVLLLVFLPGIGSSLNTGAQSWIVIGGVSIQPAEFAKLGLVLFLAGYLSLMGERIQDATNGFVQTLMFGMAPIVLVVLQPDTGTVSILFAILFGMLFFAGARFSHLGGLLGAGVVALVGLIAVAPYRAARLTTFLHPELDPQGVGYHINQAFLAIGSGGLLGMGLGRSRQKFQYLPEVHADSIFAIIAEEMGFVVSVALIALILYIGYRGLVLARRTTDGHARLVICGVICWFLAQSFLNIGAIIGVLPLTGVPLPLISHGGTAVIVALSSFAILLSASREAS